MIISYSKLFVGISLPALCTGLASLLLSISANAQTIRPTTQKELKVFDPTTGNSGNIGIRAAAGTLSYTLTLPAAAPSANQVLTANAVTGGNVTLTWATPVSGTVTSVGLSVPTGFSVSGSPVTSAGTLSLSYASGYALPTTVSQTNWEGAYNDRITAASVTGTTTKTITLTQQDGGTVTATFSDLNTDAVSSVFGRTGAVTSTTGDYTTAQVTESGNLYYTDARARAAISLATVGSNGAATYSSTTGILNIPNYTLTGLGGVGGSGTVNYLSKFAGTGTLTNSLIFDNGTNVGVGTASPSSTTRFEIRGTGTTSATTALKVDNSSGNPLLVVKNDGSVGIGTTSPLGKLEIFNNVNESHFMYINNPNESALASSSIAFSAGSTIGEVVVTNQNYNYPTNYGTDANTLQLINRAAGPLIFKTDGYSTNAERMRITSAGNVGIGTTTNLSRARLNLGNVASGANQSIFGIESTLANTSTSTSATSHRYAIRGNYNKTGSSADNGYQHGSAWFESSVESGSTTNLENVNSRIEIKSGATITNAYDFVADRQYQSPTGSATTRAGLYVRDWFATATNQYGVYIDDLISGTASNYALYSAGANDLSYFAGNVGIGVTSPGHRLDVLGDINITGSYRVNGIAQLGTSKWTSGTGDNIYKSSGNVGIGTTSPSNLLTIAGSLTKNLTSGLGWGLMVEDTRTQDQGVGGGIVFRGYKIAQTNSANFGAIAGIKENATSGNEQGSLLFYVNKGGSGDLVEVARISSSGSVGIGTTSPDHKLDIEDSVNSSLITKVRNLHSSSSASSTLRVGNNTLENLLDISGWSSTYTETVIRKRNGVSLEANGAGGLSITAGNESGVIRLFTGGEAASNQRMTILSNGNVGIGTTDTQGDKLAVYESNASTDLQVSISTRRPNTSTSAGRAQLNFATGGAVFVGGAIGSPSTGGLGLMGGTLTVTGSSHIFIGSAGGVSMSSLSGIGNRYVTVDNSGNLTATIAATSDIRLKSNIEVIPNALQKVMGLRGVTYNWKDGRDTTRVLGMIAQEVMKVAPELVFKNADGYYAIHYGETTGLLVEAIKEQQKIIEELKKTQALMAGQLRQLQADLIKKEDRGVSTAPNQ